MISEDHVKTGVIMFLITAINYILLHIKIEKQLF